MCTKHYSTVNKRRYAARDVKCNNCKQAITEFEKDTCLGFCKICYGLCARSWGN